MKKIVVGVMLAALLIACVASTAQAWSEPVQFLEGEKYQILQMFIMGDRSTGKFFFIVEKTANNFETWHCVTGRVEIHLTEDESAYLVPREDIKGYSGNKELSNDGIDVEIDVYLPLKFFIQGAESSEVVGSRWTRERIYFETATVYKAT